MDEHQVIGVAEPVNTSAEALDRLGLQPRQRSARRVVEAAVRLHKTGLPNVTRLEIQAEMEALHGRQKDGSISGRINELVCAGVLRVVGTRENPDTGMNCKTYLVPAVQARLCQ